MIKWSALVCTKFGCMSWVWVTADPPVGQNQMTRKHFVDLTGSWSLLWWPAGASGKSEDKQNPKRLLQVHWVLLTTEYKIWKGFNA